ncbi:hypothetical protein [Clostridium polynesiense]|uniref:hypothetical protein n=1 Tax=Clostridium polynesiense TaxID=1325933 RepID=UPI00058BB8E3|nr:hypothetical protein [Clostridium polynesiense]
MTKEELIEVGKYMRVLEEDKTVKIVFANLNSIYGLTYRATKGNYLMIINKNIPYILQIETLWHEAKHVYSHIDKPGDIIIYEKEADEFAKKCVGFNGEIMAILKDCF